MTETVIDVELLSGADVASLAVGDKIRVLALSSTDPFYSYRENIIGDPIFEVMHGGMLKVITDTGLWAKGTEGFTFGTDAILETVKLTEQEIEDMAIAKRAAKKSTTTTASKVAVKRPVTRKPKAALSTGGWVTLDDCFKVPRGVYNILKRNIEKSVNTMLLGPTGVGKTELAAKIAWDLGKKVHILDMGTMTDPITGLVGSHIIYVKDGKTVSEFRKSRFSDVIQEDSVVILDEISRASAQANNLLFPCLDFRRELAMEYCFDDTTPIKVNDKCVFIATANLGSQYTGTHKLDRALLDRFMLIEIDPLETAQIKETLKFHYKKLTEVEMSKIVDCYNKINKAHEDFTVGFNLSLRHLKMIGAMVEDGFTIYDSFYVICKGLGSKDGLKSLESILNTTK